eukprot:maker-scaffold_14-augustus-gene-7.16-mRNA-1 protein AED:0.24 eAED:0.24 QI:173/0/0.5/1/0.33/0.75/4/0/1003
MKSKPYRGAPVVILGMTWHADKKTTWHIIKYLVQRRGVSSLWHGLSAGVAKTVPKYLTSVVVKDIMEDTLPKYDPEDMSQYSKFLARTTIKSVVAGVAGAVITNPMDVVRNEMFKTDLGFFDTIRSLYKTKGRKWVTRGLGPNVIAVSVPVSITIFLTDIFNSINEKFDLLRSFRHLLGKKPKIKDLYTTSIKERDHLKGVDIIFETGEVKICATAAGKEEALLINVNDEGRGTLPWKIIDDQLFEITYNKFNQDLHLKGKLSTKNPHFPGILDINLHFMKPVGYSDCYCASEDIIQQVDSPKYERIEKICTPKKYYESMSNLSYCPKCENRLCDEAQDQVIEGAVYAGWSFYTQVEGNISGSGLNTFFLQTLHDLGMKGGITDTTLPDKCSLDVTGLPLPQGFCSDFTLQNDSFGHGVNAKNQDCGFSTWFNCMEHEILPEFQYTGLHIADINMNFALCLNGDEEVTPSPFTMGTKAPSISPTNHPTRLPTFTPTYVSYPPTEAPTETPTASPTAAPTAAPTSSPTETPTSTPTATPTQTPTHTPSASPTNPPSIAPTTTPTSSPTGTPTFSPTIRPSNEPTNLPTSTPTKEPTAYPTQFPSTSYPTLFPTDEVLTLTPSFIPTHEPTDEPTITPTASPTYTPTVQPSNTPTINPSVTPTQMPTNSPTVPPTVSPTYLPSLSPSLLPSSSPTQPPTKLPSQIPTLSPTQTPTLAPTMKPTLAPSRTPSAEPTLQPSSLPTTIPTTSPSLKPTPSPSTAPSSSPTNFPTSQPTFSPTETPTATPTSSPTFSPTFIPTSSPIYAPTNGPTISPSLSPTAIPTNKPTASPTNSPIELPTSSPTFLPTVSPSNTPTNSPTFAPTLSPTDTPTASPTFVPTASPTDAPTTSPTLAPTNNPTENPTQSPSYSPTYNPTISPSNAPSLLPTTSPSFVPTVKPTDSPTFTPTVTPSLSPTYYPTNNPTTSPTQSPTIAIPCVTAPCCKVVVESEVQCSALGGEYQEPGEL